MSDRIGPKVVTTDAQKGPLREHKSPLVGIAKQSLFRPENDAMTEPHVGWTTEPEAAHTCDAGDFDRTLCDSGEMHWFCSVCGRPQDACDVEGDREPRPSPDLRAALRDMERERQEGQAFYDAVQAQAVRNVTILLRKHADYGPRNISRSPGGPLNGLNVRLWDKLARLEHLLAKGAEPENESLADTLLDIANYALIGQLVLAGEWPEG